MRGTGGGPLEAAWVARQRSSCDELTAAAGALWWLQTDPDAGGTARLWRWTGRDLPRAVTPVGLPVGGWLHAYGGGSHLATESGIWLVEGNSSTVVRLDADGGLKRAVPEDEGWVYGDLQPAGCGSVLAVREHDERGDQIVEISSEGAVRVLVRSRGFLAAPRLRKGCLVFLEWDRDCMPWDEARLVLAAYGSTGAVEEAQCIAGGVGESVVQPEWGPDGALYFLSERTGWWNLYRWDGRDVCPVFSIDRDCASAPWEAGYRSYAFLPGGKIALTVHEGVGTRLVAVDSQGDAAELANELTSVKPYLAVLGGQLAVIGSSPTSPPQVRLVNPDLPRASAVPLSPPSTESDNASVPRSSLGTCEALRRGRAARFLLRLPSSHRTGGPVPLLVRAHPGPTDGVPMRLDWAAEFFTSRGMAVADVLYRGSSGLGRAFRQALYGHWGEYDVQDCAAAAEQLLAEGLARPGAVFITGASAGGYTALKAACAPGPFTAATATSAIIDPARWILTAPRFQRPHAALLAGPAGAVRARDITVPVLVVHGTDDPVAPVEDAQRLVERLRARGAPHRALFMPSGHYLSDPPSREKVLIAEWDFYQSFLRR